MNILKYLMVTMVATWGLSLFATNAQTGFNFIASSSLDAVATVFGDPFNPTCAVGATQFIESIYQNLRSYNKSTGQPDGVLNIDASAFTGTASRGGAQDVQLIYHPFIQRYIYSFESDANANEAPTSLNFMVSSGSNITRSTPWASYTIPAAQINPGGTGGSLDYQQPACDQNAWYNGVGTFNSSGTFIGSSLTVVSNSSILAGSPNITVFPELLNNVGFLAEGFAAPANNFDANPTYGYFVGLVFESPDFLTGTQMQMYRILDAGSNTPTLGPLVTFTATPFAATSLAAPHKGNLFGLTGQLQTTPSVFGNGVHVRNKQLYLVTPIAVDDTGAASATGDRTAVIWWQFDLTGDPTGQGKGTESPSTVPVLIQTTTIFDSSASDPLSYYIPSIMTNKNSDMVISFNISGNNAYVNAGYAFRAGSDPLNTLRAPVYTTNSTVPTNWEYNTSELPGPNLQRWGDGSKVALDPSDNLTFWMVQAWGAYLNTWGIQATQVIPV